MADIVEDPEGGMFEIRAGGSGGASSFTSLRDAISRARSTEGIVRDLANHDAMASALVGIGACTATEATSLGAEEVRARMRTALAEGALSLVPYVQRFRPVCSVLDKPEALEVETLSAGPEPEMKAKHQLEIRLVDDDGEPLAGEPYRVELPDGELIEGNLDGNGRALLTGIEASGNCVVMFPRWDQDAWGAA